MGDKWSVNKFKRIKIIKSMFSDNDAIKIEINDKKMSGKSLNIRN